MILSEAQTILASMLNPVSYDDFFDHIVGKKPLALLNQLTHPRADLLGADPKHMILQTYPDYATKLTCHIQTPLVPPPQPKAVRSHTEFSELIRQYHQTGYTVRIPDVLNLSPELSRFTRALEFVFQNPVGVVIFWSDSGAKAPVHHDEVDVIVIQLTGKKRWFISDEQPKLSNKWKGFGEQPPLMGQYSTYDVAPGDLLYVPRGTAHTVESTTESIHLSIGFVPVTVREALAAALDYCADLDRPLRLDLGQRADQLATEHITPQMQQQIRQGMDRLRQICQSDLFLRDMLAFRRARMIHELPKLPVSMSKAELTLNSQVRHRPLAIAALIATPEILDYRQPGKQNLIHLGVEPCLRFMIHTPQFCVTDIPGEVSAEVKLALVQKMISDGFLEIC